MKNKKELKINKIKKGDLVMVIAGKDRGKKGKVEKVLTKKKKAIVTGINILKKHVRPSNKNPKGGIIEFPAPIDISNLMIICSKCNKPTRIGYKFIKNNQKIRICKKCHEVL